MRYYCLPRLDRVNRATRTYRTHDRPPGLCRRLQLLRGGMRGLLVFLACLPSVLAQGPCEDSDAKRSIWELTSSRNTDGLIDALKQNPSLARDRAGDCRGLVFWAFEFKNVDALALYMHLDQADSMDLDQTDSHGQKPPDLFDGSDEELQGIRLALVRR